MNGWTTKDGLSMRKAIAIVIVAASILGTAIAFGPSHVPPGPTGGNYSDHYLEGLLAARAREAQCEAQHYRSAALAQLAERAPPWLLQDGLRFPLLLPSGKGCGDPLDALPAY